MFTYPNVTHSNCLNLLTEKNHDHVIFYAIYERGCYMYILFLLTLAQTIETKSYFQDFSHLKQLIF